MSIKKPEATSTDLLDLSQHNVKKYFSNLGTKLFAKSGNVLRCIELP